MKKFLSILLFILTLPLLLFSAFVDAAPVSSKKKAKISEFLAWAESHAGSGKGIGQIGYVLGATGQLGTINNITALCKSCFGLAWAKHFAITKRWVGHIITDCNGVAEAFLNKVLGGNHNTRAKYNYSQWCAGHNGKSLKDMPQVPGTAIFCANALGVVYHVGYLLRKYGPGPLDWFVLNNGMESHGLMITKISDSKSWNRWGQMIAEFEYDVPAVAVSCPYSTPTLLPKYSTIIESDAVRWLQWWLVQKGYKLPKYGIDGQWGKETDTAFRAFQSARGFKPLGTLTADMVKALVA